MARSRAGLRANGHKGPQTVELRNYLGFRGEVVTLQHPPLAVAHEKRRYFFLHQLLGHGVFVGVEPYEQDGFVAGVIGEFGEGRGQRLANGTAVGGKFGKYLQVLVREAAQVFVVGIDHVFTGFFGHKGK